MVISSHHLLLIRLSILLALLAISANARPGCHFHPCKTLIFFTTTFTSNPLLHQNPNFSPQNPTSTNPSLTFFFTQSRDFNPKLTFLPFHPSPLVHRSKINEEIRPLPLGFHASLHDQTKDILKDVGSLLLSIACGAIIAGTLYLIWSLFANPNSFEFCDSDDDFDGADDVNLKKIGYITVPAIDTPAMVKEEV
ncbi:hypothetical protein LOK49_LG08G02152 [Camellia lanceoleosa]|uniref:Uncharacterized protein n=1 Tax=Camellia lanceoleosa TaxID=1840588 RepID=A0ACC0GVZ1_9ERIC|nr:hypothetical protein LOK49_LG08G02152 [Camellia lanceoleosa]